MRILFSDEKLFDIDGVYNVQNDRVWTPGCVEANKNGGIAPRRKFPQKVMVLLGAYSNGITPLVLFEEGTLDRDRYIKEVLPMPLKYGNKVFGNDWTFEQNGARFHIHYLTQTWYRDCFPSFIEKGRWSCNSLDLNLLDYCFLDEVAKGIDWTQISTKQDLIDELHRTTKELIQQLFLKVVTHRLIVCGEFRKMMKIIY